MLTDDELRAFLRACDRMGEPFGPLFRLLLLTGQRREEVAAMPWAELDLAGAVWHLPAARTKNKRASDVPLAEQAVAILEGLMPPLAARLPGAVLPRRAHRAAAALRLRPGEGTAGRADARGAAEGATPRRRCRTGALHDLRRTAATGMARLGVAVHVVEKLLNHVSGTFAGVVGVYQRHDFAAEKRAAAQAWANYLDSLTAERPANVVIVRPSSLAERSASYWRRRILEEITSKIC